MAVGFVLITTEPGEEVNVRNSLDSVEGVVGRWVVLIMTSSSRSRASTSQRSRES